MVMFELDREECHEKGRQCADLHEAIGHVIPKCDAVAIRSYVTREIAFSLIDAMREGKKIEACGLTAPENGANDTAAWLNYNALMEMKSHHQRAYTWFIKAIEQESAHREWGLDELANE